MAIFIILIPIHGDFFMPDSLNEHQQAAGMESAYRSQKDDGSSGDDDGDDNKKKKYDSDEMSDEEILAWNAKEALLFIVNLF